MRETYSYACRNIVNTIKTNETQFFRKIYLSHFIRNSTKGLCVRGELETEQNCNILPPALLAIAALLSHTAGLLNQGSWWPSSLLGLVLTASNCNNWLQTPNFKLTELHCLTSTCFLWASHLHRIQPVHGQGYTLISSTGWACSLIDGWVSMLHEVLPLRVRVDLWAMARKGYCTLPKYSSPGPRHKI